MPEPRVSDGLKRAVTARAAGCCEYCRSQEKYATHRFSAEHVVPRRAGGATAMGNLALACQGCNNHKHTKTHARDPVTGEVVPLYHPRRQRWSDHFAWRSDFTRVIGVTAIGRATGEALQLNRGNLLTLRGALSQLGVHPPSEPDGLHTAEETVADG